MFFDQKDLATWAILPDCTLKPLVTGWLGWSCLRCQEKPPTTMKQKHQGKLRPLSEAEKQQTASANLLNSSALFPVLAVRDCLKSNGTCNILNEVSTHSLNYLALSTNLSWNRVQCLGSSNQSAASTPQPYQPSQHRCQDAPRSWSHHCKCNCRARSHNHGPPSWFPSYFAQWRPAEDSFPVRESLLTYRGTQSGKKKGNTNDPWTKKGFAVWRINTGRFIGPSM